MSSYAFTLPFAMDENSVKAIVAKRQLIQKRTGGKSIQGIIPEWAGQWGLIGGPSQTGESLEDTAKRTFKEQAALDLTDQDVLDNFLLENNFLSTLQTPNYQNFGVLCIFTTLKGLENLQTVLSDVIATSQSTEGTLAETQILTIPNVREKLGPTPPPPDGWNNYLITNYYGGKAPGQLNTEINTLTTSITDGAAQNNAFFATALGDKAVS